MPLFRPRATLLAATLAMATAARADDRPLTLPSRDVDVTYQVTSAAAAKPLSQRIRWTAATRQMRIDTPSPGLYVVMDYRSHLLSAIRPAERMALQIHSDGADLTAGRSGFVRGADDMVAGLACTDWRTGDTSGAPTTLCLTGDGVMLRAIVGQSARVEAVHVAYGPLSPDLFAVPADFRVVTQPGARP